MSNPFAVGAVTATFAQLLGRVIEEPSLAGATVSTGPPDAVSRSSKDRLLNLFLYDVSPNGGWRNMDLPFRSSNGSISGQPVLALDLHYLVTAYGQGDDELDAHHLLAHAMSLVNDNGVLTPDEIRAALLAQPSVAQSDLADQADLVRITPHTLSTEEISKLWGMFQTTNYRLSIAFQACPVLIERVAPVRAALPVRQLTLTVLPFDRPVIESLDPQIIGPGGQVGIRGRNLRGDDVLVRFGDEEVPPDSLTNGLIVATLPADLRAGIGTVQVVHRLDFGEPPAAHRGFESNVAAFILAPQLTTPPPISVAAGDVLTLDFEPEVARSQRLSALIGDREVLADRSDDAPPASSADFPVPNDIAAGDHLLRIRADGAESALTIDDDENSPTFGQYIGPIVTVTP